MSGTDSNHELVENSARRSRRLLRLLLVVLVCLTLTPAALFGYRVYRQAEIILRLHSMGHTLTEPVGVGWQRKLLGERYAVALNEVVWVGLNEQNSDHDLFDLTQLIAVRHVALDSNNITSQGLQLLEQINGLKVLDVYRRTLSSSDMRSIAHVDLRSLHLDQIEIEEAGLVYLTRMPQLEVLEISDSLISGELLKAISNLRNLKRLKFRGSRFEGVSLENLVLLEDLESIDLGLTDVDDRQVETLCKIQNLKQLDLTETRITDGVIESFNGLNRLERLDLGINNITDLGIRNFPDLSHLLSLDLQKTKVSDSQLTILKKRYPRCEILYGQNLFPEVFVLPAE